MTEGMMERMMEEQGKSSIAPLFQSGALKSERNRKAEDVEI